MRCGASSDAGTKSLILRILAASANGRGFCVLSLAKSRAQRILGGGREGRGAAGCWRFDCDASRYIPRRGEALEPSSLGCEPADSRVNAMLLVILIVLFLVIGGGGYYMGPGVGYYGGGGLDLILLLVILWLFFGRSRDL